MILFSLILKHPYSFRQSGTCIHTTVRTGSLKMYIDSTQVTVVDFIIIQNVIIFYLLLLVLITIFFKRGLYIHLTGVMEHQMVDRWKGSTFPPKILPCWIVFVTRHAMSQRQIVLQLKVLVKSI